MRAWRTPERDREPGAKNRTPQSTWENVLSWQWDLWNFVIHDLGSQILSAFLMAAMGKAVRKAIGVRRERRNNHGQHDTPIE